MTSKLIFCPCSFIHDSEFTKRTYFTGLPKLGMIITGASVICYHTMLGLRVHNSIWKGTMVRKHACLFHGVHLSHWLISKSLLATLSTKKRGSSWGGNTEEVLRFGAATSEIVFHLHRLIEQQQDEVVIPYVKDNMTCSYFMMEPSIQGFYGLRLKSWELNRIKLRPSLRA